MNRALVGWLLAALALAGPLQLGAVATGDAPGVHGNHIKLNFRLDGAGMVPTAVVALQDAAGDLVLYAYTDNDRLYLSDGASGGVDRPAIQLGNVSVSNHWHRLDVVLHGSTYTLHLDQKHSATARTFTPATAGTWVPDPRPLLGAPYEDVTWTRHRVDDSGMAYDETFSDATTSWDAVVDGGAVRVVTSLNGHQSPGRAEVVGPYGLGTAYLRAPTTGLDGSYTMQASIASFTPLDTPVGLAVLAGLSGTATSPDVQWSLVMDRVPPSPYDWAVFLVDGDGHRTQVSPTWSDLVWHTVEARVDEAADCITVITDGGPPVTVSGELGASTHIGAGDVFGGLLPTVGNRALFDDLALYTEANP